jgi:DNA-directed RNA polymerase subunit RPC12/RpoP
MDIKYKDKDVKIVIKNINKNSILTNDELESVIKIINMFKDSKESVQGIMSDIAKNVSKIKEEPVRKTKEDRPIVRDRIPNQVDMSEIEIKKAVTEEPMIRCPNCGQSSKAIVHISPTENYLLRKVTCNNKKTFETVLELTDENSINNILMPEGANILDYHSDIMKIKQNKKLKDTDLNVSNSTIIQCPCCNEKVPFAEWVDAFKNPLEHGFETELLCPVCGGEAVKAIDENKNEILQCEHCGNKEPIV